MLKLHFKTIRGFNEEIVCKTLYMHSPMKPGMLRRFVRKENITGIVLVDPLIDYKDVVGTWALPYSQIIKSICVGDTPITVVASAFEPAILLMTIDVNE